MPKKYVRRYTKRRTTFRRKRKSTAKKFGSRQQFQASTYIRKRYTKVFILQARLNGEVAQTTVSLIGAKNASDTAGTITLFDVNQDNQLGSDMDLYQFFKIRGVACKLFFPMPTDVASSPIQWALGYSASDVIKPTLAADKLQTLATYQTGSCNQNTAITRYYNTSAALKRLGIEYASTEEFNAFGGDNDLYNGQLEVDSGSSVNLKVYRALNTDMAEQTPIRTLARLQVTYYVTYKGTKGSSSLTA